MNSIQELRERRAAKAIEARKLLDDHTGDKWTAAVGEQCDTLYNEIGALEDQIRVRERALEIEDENRIVPYKSEDHDPKSPKALMVKWMRGGDKVMTADDWTTIRATMSTTTAGEGGYTVATEVARQVVDALKMYGGMRSVAEIIPTSGFGDLNYPTSDGTAEVGELIAQNTTATALDPSFGVITITPYKFSSKIVAVPFELLQDSAVDIEAFVRKRLEERIGRINNTYFTTGTGSSQPRGIVPATTAGKTGTTGQTLTVIFDDLVDLIHSVDPAYREGGACRWMMHDSSLKVVRKIKDTAGRPIFLPGYDGLGAKMGDTILGYETTINQDVAVMAANAKSILFGDMKKYVIRDVMAVQLFRFDDSAYIKLGQIGFLMWTRNGGNFVDVGGAVKHYANSAT